MVTFLHHNDNHTPWYGDEEWNLVRGSLSSVDRDYGPLVNWMIHNTNYHQIHHLFPLIPHYNLQEATREFTAAYPDLYRRHSGSVIQEFLHGVYNLLVHGNQVPHNQHVFRYCDRAAPKQKKNH